MSGGTLHAANLGIGAVSVGNGGVRVNMSGGQVGSAAQRTGSTGIFTTTLGTGGNIDITANTVFSTGDAIRAEIANAASSGNINIGNNAGATVNASGGIGANLLGGDLNTLTNLGALSGTTALRTTAGATTIINAAASPAPAAPRCSSAAPTTCSSWTGRPPR